jgi:hypothetical protein
MLKGFGVYVAAARSRPAQPRGFRAAGTPAGPSPEGGDVYAGQGRNSRRYAGADDCGYATGQRGYLIRAVCRPVSGHLEGASCARGR